jgi:hypothetical protein
MSGRKFSFAWLAACAGAALWPNGHGGDQIRTQYRSEAL